MEAADNLWQRAAEIPATDFAVVQAMTRYGGSFARALGEAARSADPDNLARIKAAFPELWNEYRHRAAFDALSGQGPK